MRAVKADIETARLALLQALPPGSTAYTILRHVSRSGMSRSISVLAVSGDGLQDLTWAAGRLLGWAFDTKRDGLRVSGCGMDMGFHLVYTLARVLYPQGFICTGEHCPSNAHSNGDHDYLPHPHVDGGYALRQRWI